MPQSLKVLIAEDNPADAEMVLRELRRSGFEPDWQRVDTEAGYIAHLHDGLDLVVSDFQMPQFTGLRALELLKQRGLKVPFILVSGTIGEDIAVEAMKSGATDYLMKDRLARLGATVVHAMAERKAWGEQARAETALHEVEGKYRAIFENSSDGIFQNTPEGSFIAANQAMAQILGFASPEELIRERTDIGQQGYAEPALREKFRRQLEECGFIKDFEYEVPRKDGSKIWISENVRVVRDATGKAQYYEGSVRDITERRRAEESLRLLNSAVLQSKESILITDARLDRPGPKIVFVNPAFTTMTGYTAEEVIGQTPRILQGPRTDKAVLSRLRRNLERGEAFAGEAINYRKDGTEYDQEWQITPIRDGSGVITHFLATQRDVTEHKRGLEALRASEQRFKALFEQAAVGVVQSDVETERIVQANLRFCDILGYSRSELEQLTVSAIIHPLDRNGNPDAMQRLLAGAIREFKREKRYLRKDGSEVWADLTVSAMWDPGEKPDYLLAVVQDITGRKQLEEQFRQAQKMEAIGTLAGGIAHDFNNILTSINGYTELSRMVLKENPDVRDYLGAVLKATKRAADLVRQILTFSRQDRSERRLIALRPIVAESLELLRASIPTTVEFETSLASDAPTVLADATQVHQIMMNLGTNAWHAMKDGPGRLRVRLERWVVELAQATAQPRLRPGIYARVSVSDTGCGMDPETVRRIFEPFFTTKPSGEGTGLGLAVVHGIMDSHDGAITVYSQPGEGTVFHLYFPAHVGEAAVAPSIDETLPRGQGERVLIVDDEELLAELGQKALAALGYEVEAVSQPAVALDLVRADPGHFAVVLTDQTMPGMTGLMLATQLRQIRPGLPIILMTGNSLAITPERLEAAGIGQLLLKPPTLHALGAAVHAALSSRLPPR